LNKKNEAAMKTGQLEIMATLVKRCDSDGTEIARRPYGVPRMGVLGQGFPLVIKLQAIGTQAQRRVKTFSAMSA